MTADQGHLDKADPLQEGLPPCPDPQEAILSPLGWSIRGRLLCAGAASALLWLMVAWALGWFG